LTSDSEIRIRGRVYRKNPALDRYQIDLDELGDLRMCDVPGHSHLEVVGLPEPLGASEVECFALNGGDSGEHEFLSVYGGTSYRVPVGERARILRRLRRAFPETQNHGSMLPNPWITTQLVDADVVAHLYFSVQYKDNPEARVRDAVIPFVKGFDLLAKPYAHVFICYASEDKPAACALASGMARLGVEVWFDEWEIKVGESIVQRINDALGGVSHLIVLLSRDSVEKPWVRKELSSALMRQLSAESVTVLPLRLDDCPIPPILRDIKYADARKGIARALIEVEQALFPPSEKFKGT